MSSQSPEASEPINTNDSKPTVPLAAPFSLNKSTKTESKPSIFGSSVSKDDNSNANNDSTPSGFVFGSRLSEKVINAKSNSIDEGPKDASSIFKKFSGTGAGLFCKPASSISETNEIKPFFAETEERPREDRHDNPTQTFTGEENETNLLHIGCKFYIYERDSKTWQERGNGVLRINRHNEENDSYRIIGRATGNQRVCVNSKIFADMLIEKLSDKRVKLTAIDPDTTEVQIVIIHASPTSIVTIIQKLEDLLNKVKLVKRKRKLSEDNGNEVAVKKDNVEKDVAKNQEVKETVELEKPQNKKQEESEEKPEVSEG